MLQSSWSPTSNTRYLTFIFADSYSFLMILKSLFSQNHRSTGTGRALWRSWSPTPAKQLPAAGRTGKRPCRSPISPQKETPPPLCTARSRALSAPQERSFSSPSYGTSHVPLCTHCPLLCHWALLKNAWPHPADFRYCIDQISSQSSPCWAVPGLWASDRSPERWREKKLHSKP